MEGGASGVEGTTPFDVGGLSEPESIRGQEGEGFLSDSDEDGTGQGQEFLPDEGEQGGGWGDVLGDFFNDE